MPARRPPVKIPPRPEKKQSGEALMRNQRYGTYVVGIDVHMELGDKSVKMDYNTALNLAAMLYDSGKRAKQAAGDHTIRVTAVGRLTDANLEEMKAQRSRDRTAVFSKVGR